MYDFDKKCVKCGVVNIDGEFAEVFGRPSTDDVVFTNPSGDMDNCIISGLPGTAPKYMKDTNGIKRALLNGDFGKGALGAVFTEDAVYIILSESVAEKREYADPFTAMGNTVKIDMDAVDMINSDDDDLEEEDED